MKQYHSISDLSSHLSTENLWQERIQGLRNACTSIFTKPYCENGWILFLMSSVVCISENTAMQLILITVLNISTLVSECKCLVERTAITHRSMFVIIFAVRVGEHKFP